MGYVALTSPALAAPGEAKFGNLPSENAQPLVGDARIVDGDTLVLGDTRIRLFGIDAPELSQTCLDGRGRSWSCGVWSKSILEALSTGRVDCQPLDQDRYGRTVARCFAGGTDIAADMVRRGAAYAYRRYSTDYVSDEDRARRADAGLWRGEAMSPATFRAQKAEARVAATAPQSAPTGCTIKGNISANGKLYHLPGGRWYDKTRINETKGERWFCSEGEARKAGWTAAQG